MIITLIISVIFGILAGWLVNYLGDVLPLTRRFSEPVCLQCGTAFKWNDYLLFRRCSNGHSRNVRAWIVQALILAASVYIGINPPAKLGYALGLILIVYFGVVFVIDLEHRLILHPTSVFGALFGLLAGSVSHGVESTLLGGFAGLAIMLAVYYFGVLFSKLRNRRLAALGHEPDDEEALGAGDVILATILGFILGWPFIWFGLLMGILLGGIVSVFVVLWVVVRSGYKQNALMMFIPYGPYFITSAFLIMYFPRFVAMLIPG
ncbi:MAG: prepilin peptidase [Chloroflexi bacterium]|nr:prepilin peptidase [Chloroflexota bacterium]